MKDHQVGIIDIGSNSIKLLIAERDNSGAIHQVRYAIEEVRIGEGMTHSPPAIDALALERGTLAVANLYNVAQDYDFQKFTVVATSAVRDAVNKSDFVDSIREATGLELVVLSGQDEARLIGKGVCQDPALHSLDSFILADLGGGSMECIHFEDLVPKVSHSFNLGAVRLTSRFIKNRYAAVTPQELEAIINAVRSDLHNSPFPPSLKIETAVLTGGAAAILTQLAPDDRTSQSLKIEAAKQIRDRVCVMSSDERISQLGIPPKRADIFPAATIVLCELLDYLGCDTACFSAYNLRFGLAAELFESL